MKMSREYSQEDCINALQSAADQLGKSPTLSEYSELGVSPSAGTIKNVVGSWNEAKDVAGLERSTGGNLSPIPETLHMSEDEWQDLSIYQRRYVNNKEKIALYKLRRGCSECGYDSVADALEFHHTNPSEKEMELSVSQIMREGWNNAMDEIEKCVILCSNCHREREAKYEFSVEE